MQQTLNFYRRCAALAREGALDPAGQQETGCTQSNPAYGPELQAAEESFAARPSLWATLASESESFYATQPGMVPTDTREVEATRGDFGSLPLVILQSSDPLPDNSSGVSLSAETRSAYFQLRVEMLNELAALSTRGSRFVVPNTSHYIQLDDPQAVIDAIEGVVCVARDPGVPCT